MKKEENLIVTKLKTLWSEILDVSEDQITDLTFFELGGDSLGAMKFLYEIEQNFQYELSFKDFMNDPTITGISALLMLHEGSNHNNSDREKGIISI